MQDSNEIPHGRFFQKHLFNRNRDDYAYQAIDSPYLLESINEIDKLFVAKEEKLGELTSSMVASHSDATGFEKSMIKYTFLEDDGNILMVRASNCKYLVALVYKHTIRIEKPGKFLKAKKHGPKTEIGSSLMEAEFKNKEGSYTYLEWPVLSETYIEKPYFLTLDNQGRLRIHYVKEKSEEIVTEEEKYRCGCFSVDGREIYAINEQQELCRINLRDLKTIVSKIKIPGLDNPEKIVSRHIFHVAPLIFAIGFIRKKTKNSIETFKPYFQIISGDIFDLNQELKMKEFSMPKINDNPILFRSLYIKERQLLLFGHNESNKVHAVHFDFGEILFYDFERINFRKMEV